MRNKLLNDILYSLAYDRGHSAGEDEVNIIYEELCYRFKEIDAMLPQNMPAKFKEGDKVVVWNEKAVVKKVVEGTLGFSYEVSIPAYDDAIVSVSELDVKEPFIVG